MRTGSLLRSQRVSPNPGLPIGLLASVPGVAKFGKASGSG